MIPRWAPMYSWWIQDEVIQRLNWRNNELGRPAAKTAALMLYIAITMKSSEEPGMSPVKITYNRLSEMTGISRELIREGITILESLEMISVEKVGRNNIYKLINKLSSEVISKLCKPTIRQIFNSDVTIAIVVSKE